MRYKKQVQKCKGKNLRVLAILTQALRSAENEIETLHRKQQERAHKWARIRQRLNEPQVKLDADETVEIDQDKIDELWNTELNGLDTFMNNLSQIKTVVVR
jgi:hypothetical protein